MTAKIRKIVSPSVKPSKSVGLARRIPKKASPVEVSKRAADFYNIKPVTPREKDWRSKTKKLWDMVLYDDKTGVGVPFPAWMKAPKKRVSNKNTYLYVAFGDSQVPYHDSRAIALILKFILKKQPAGVVYLGDGIDFPAISHYNKTLKEEIGLLEDLEKARALNCLIRTVAPYADMAYTAGNHEARWNRWFQQDITRAMGLVADVLLPLPKLLGMDVCNIQYFDFLGKYLLYRLYRHYH